MRIDTVNRIVYVRQSWLNDVALCPERSRLKLVYPQMSGATDATIMGTAVHYGIENVLTGEIPVVDAIPCALDKFAELLAEPHKKTTLAADKYDDHIRSMMTAFTEGILPEVQLGGMVEHKFKYPMGIMAGDYAIWAEGTMDYVQPDGTVWDWKTASRVYNARDKQSTSIQATVYAGAVFNEGLTDYPCEFRYGVMVRQDKPKAQIVALHRNENHMRWLQRMTVSAVQMRFTYGEDNPWLMNDTSALCSQIWCPYWSMCKGALMSSNDFSLLVDTPRTIDIQSPTTTSNMEVANDNQ